MIPFLLSKLMFYLAGMQIVQNTKCWILWQIVWKIIWAINWQIELLTNQPFLTFSSRFSSTPAAPEPKWIRSRTRKRGGRERRARPRNRSKTKNRFGFDRSLKSCFTDQLAFPRHLVLAQRLRGNQWTLHPAALSSNLFNGPILAFFNFIFVFSLVQNWLINFCRCWDSNRRSLA